MRHKPGKTRSGLTLIELMLAITVIVVGVLGAMMFRYGSALEARKADIQVGAGRVALLILEGWKGAIGSTTYNPKTDISLSGNISISGTGPYTVQLTGGGMNTSYSASLTRLDGATHDINGDGFNDLGLVELTVTVTSSLRPLILSDFVRTN